MRPCKSRARSPVMSESSMALRNANASPKSRSARKRRRLSRTRITTTEASAIAMPVTVAVITFGNTLGARCQLSMRSTMVLPGKSKSCCEVNTRDPRQAAPTSAKRVPSGSVKETSWLCVRFLLSCVNKMFCNEYVPTMKPLSCPSSIWGRHTSINSAPMASPRIWK